MSMSNLLFTQHIFLETSNLSEQDWLHHVFRRKCETTLACNFFLNAALAMNTDTWSVACRLFNLFKESILFPTSYFIVSKRWLIKDWMTPFFFARKFRQRAGQRGPRSCYFRTREKKLLSLVSDLPFHYITHVWRVTCDVTLPGSQRFQNGRQLSTKEKLSKIWFCTNYLLFVHLGFLKSRGICWYNKKKGGQIWSQLPFKK